MRTALITLSLLLFCLPARAERDWGGADAPYLKALHERIHPRWAAFLGELPRMGPTYQDPRLRAELVIAIAADGTLAGTALRSKTGVAGFDDATVDVVRDVGRLPPPPAGLRSDDGRVYVRWGFARQPPGCDDFAVIEQRLPLP